MVQTRSQNKNQGDPAVYTKAQPNLPDTLFVANGTLLHNPLLPPPRQTKPKPCSASAPVPSSAAPKPAHTTSPSARASSPRPPRSSSVTVATLLPAYPPPASGTITSFPAAEHIAPFEDPIVMPCFLGQKRITKKGKISGFSQVRSKVLIDMQVW